LPDRGAEVTGGAYREVLQREQLTMFVHTTAVFALTLSLVPALDARLERLRSKFARPSRVRHAVVTPGAHDGGNGEATGAR
jgi:hypothetical protein